MPALRIAYFGLPIGALLLLRDGHELVVTALPPVPAPGRRRLARRLSGRALDGLVLGVALEARVDRVLGPNSEALGGNVDLVVSWFWTRKLPERWLRLGRFGGVGVHPSLLPRHRGPNPYFWAIDEGDRETGVTAHRLDPDYDSGPIYAVRTLEVGERNSWQLAHALDRPSLALLREVVRAFASGRPPSATPQDEARATQAPEPSGALLRVDWSWPTARVLRRIRALAPVPGLQLAIRGIELEVVAAVVARDYPAALEPGEAGVLDQAPWLVIRTGDGAIALTEALEGRTGQRWSAAELCSKLRERAHD